MAISVSFGTTNRDLRWLDKEPVWKVESLPCDVYEPTDRINPIILVDNDATHVDLKECNYMYIPEFGRYYCITSIIGSAGKQLRLTGHVDALMTYKDDILKCRCIAERSTSNYSLYLQDNRRLFKSYVQNDYYDIQDLGLPTAIVLMTLGKGGNSD